MGKLVVAGIGPGSPGYVMPEVIKAMKESDLVIAARRILPMLEKICPEGVYVPMGKISETLTVIDANLNKQRNIVLVVSGDPLMYSLYRTIQQDPRSEDWEMDILPGIGSLQMLGAAIGQTMEDACILSVHGRNLAPGRIAREVAEHEKVFLLCSKDQGPAWLAEIMIDYGLAHVTMYAGSDLSYDTEQIVSGAPEKIMQMEFPSLVVAAIINPRPRQLVRPKFLRDEDFERGRTPMTKEEIRVLILHKLALQGDEVVWDIGAGTGSVSIECARQLPYGSVYSVERDEAAVSLISKNKEKFETDQLYVCEGTAADWLEKLPRPDKVFIGGSGGQLSDIIKTIASFHHNVRVVMSAVSIETIAQAGEILGTYDPDYEVIQATVGRGRKIGGYHIMDTNNPVMIFTAIV